METKKQEQVKEDVYVTQLENIRQHLNSGKPITALDALNLYGCFRLSAHIFTLRNEGMNIVTERIVRNGKWFAQYSLA